MENSQGREANGKIDGRKRRQWVRELGSLWSPCVSAGAAEDLKAMEVKSQHTAVL